MLNSSVHPESSLSLYIYFVLHFAVRVFSTLNPLKSELLTKQACRDELVVYSLFFSPTTYTSLYLYVLSTFLRISNFTLYIYIYMQHMHMEVRSTLA